MRLLSFLEQSPPSLHVIAHSFSVTNCCPSSSDPLFSPYLTLYVTAVGGVKGGVGYYRVLLE